MFPYGFPPHPGYPMMPMPPNMGIPPPGYPRPPMPGMPFMPPMGMAPPPGFMPRPPMFAPMPPRGPMPGPMPVPLSAPPATPLAEPVSVYIGKIPSDIDDSFMMKLLLACGHVTKWRRTTDSETGMLKAFGFCDYSSLDAVRRALKFLNGLKIDAATLIAKVDSKVQTMLDDPANASTAPPDADNMANKIITDLVSARKAEYEAYAVTAAELQRTNEYASGAPRPDDGQTIQESAGVVLSEIEKFKVSQARQAEELDRVRMDRVKRQLEDVKRRQAAEASAKAEKEEKKRSRSRSRGRRSHSRSRSRDRRRDKQRGSRSRSRSHGRRDSSHSRKEDEQDKNRDREVDKKAEPAPAAAPAPEPAKISFGFAKKPATAPAPATSAKTLFGVEEDATLRPLQKDQLASTDLIETLKAQIPKDRDALFAYPMHWDVVDAKDIPTKMKSWLSETMTQYLGDSDADMIAFIVTQIRKRGTPQELATGLRIVFDKDTEAFVEELWAHLILEVLLAKQTSGA